MTAGETALIIGDTTVANIIVAMDDVLDSNAMLLKVFPDDDPTQHR
jgi:hypothetical protein